MKIKRFNESAKDAVQLVILIKDDGEKFRSEGYAEEGVGIFDYDGNEYPAGVDVQGNVHASISDDEGNVYASDGETVLPDVKMEKTVNPILEGKSSKDPVDKLYVVEELMGDGTGDEWWGKKLVAKTKSGKEYIIRTEDTDFDDDGG